MFKGGSLQVDYKLLTKLQKNKSDYRISYTITYKIYNLKNDRLQQQANQLFIVFVQEIKALKHHINNSSQLWDHHQYIIMSNINNNLRRFRRLSTNVVKIITDDLHS